MNSVKVLVAKKDRNFLIFDNGERVIRFDLSDNTFKKVLKSGELKPLAHTGVSSFFRGIDVHSVGNAFKDDPVYGEIVNRLVRQEHFRQNANFASIFARVEKYMHMESYLLLGIKVDSSIQRPVSQFSKAVIRFMRESGFTFGSQWENAYKDNAKLINDLCQYLLDNYHDDLLVYGYFYKILTHYGIWPKFVLLTKPITEEGTEYRVRGTKGFGAEYKALFDYVIRCIAVEAMVANDVIDEYYDYLDMARRIKQLKHITRLREQGDRTSTLATIGFVDYKKIEKYPKGLTIRHRIVTRNFEVMQQEYDAEKFAAMIDHDYAYSDKEYCVVTAKKPADIKNEGTELNHCVGSYIDAVLQGRTQICFLRKADTPETSLVTIEIRSRGIQQARGYGNRELYPEEKAWLEKYAKVRNLTYGSVRSDENLPCPLVKPKKVEGTAEEHVEVITGDQVA